MLFFMKNQEVIHKKQMRCPPGARSEHHAEGWCVCEAAGPGGEGAVHLP